MTAIPLAELVRSSSAAERTYVTLDVLNEVLQERRDQYAKHGEQDHPSFYQVFLDAPAATEPEWMTERYGLPTAAHARNATEFARSRGNLNWAHILVEELAEAIEAGVSSEQQLRDELVQIAAVAVAWIESLDRSQSLRVYQGAAEQDTAGGGIGEKGGAA